MLDKKLVVEITIISSIVIAVLLSYPTDQNTSTRYKAAIVEFNPNHQDVTANLNGLERMLREIDGSDKADIVVFPEYAIVGFEDKTKDTLALDYETIPDTNKDINPCIDKKYTNSEHRILKRLSCLARKFEIVLVANVGEKEVIHSTKSLFNTNVVFETDGRLIVKYRKKHLTPDEKKLGITAAATQPCVVFDTSFGVTFGTLICFELLYREPANCMIDEKHVRNVVFTTAWGNNFPFYMSIAMQQAWSMKHGVNLLAANLQQEYMSGSGIYSDGHAIEYYIVGYNSLPPSTGKFIVSELSEFPPESTQNGINSKSHRHDVTNIKVRSSKYLNYKEHYLKEKSGEVTATNGKLTCTLKYVIRKTSSEEYKSYGLGAYIGKNPLDATFEYAVCALMKCRREIEDYPCQKPTYTTSTVFQELHLSGTFPKGSNLYATALGNELMLLPPQSFILRAEESSLSIEYKEPLLSAGLWTRVNES